MKLQCLITLFLASCSVVVHGQSLNTSHYPKYNESVSLEEYEIGRSILQNTYNQIEMDSGKVNAADYWNVAASYNRMGASADTIEYWLRKMMIMDGNALCSYSSYFIDLSEGVEKTGFYKILGHRYLRLIEHCDLEISAKTLEEYILEKERRDLTGFDETLINKIIILLEKDQRYRYRHSVYMKNLDRQHQLDEEVSKELGELIDAYGYIGKDLVGDDYKNYVCLMIEHAGGANVDDNLRFKEKYFPIVLEAYHDGQLDFGFLSMLIDRIHLFRDGKQLFGSQLGQPFYQDFEIEKFKQVYGLY